MSTNDGYQHKRRGLSQVFLDQDVYSLALQRADYVLDNYDKAAVMFSGGKDSTATLQVVLHAIELNPKHRRHLPLRAVFFDEEAIPQETADYVARTFARDDVAGEWLCLPVEHRNACSNSSPYWWPWAPEDQHLWCRPLPEQAITEVPGFPIWPPDQRMSIPAMTGLLFPPPASTAVFMGIRAAESLVRHRAVTKKLVDNYIIPYTGPTSRGNVFKVYPVFDMSDEDVWVAPHRFGWDYNRAYDHLEMAGVPLRNQRCSPAFGEQPLQKIHTYAECFPDVWDKMAERVPGIRAAYRYALTELYGYRDRPEKPPQMTWPDFLSHYLTKFRPKEQKHVALRIKDILQLHYKKTTDPILVKARHPLSGVSWDFLLLIAIRGDLKNRAQPASRLGDDKTIKNWARYVRELETLIQTNNHADLAYPRTFPTDARALIPTLVREEVLAEL